MKPKTYIHLQILDRLLPHVANAATNKIRERLSIRIRVIQYFYYIWHSQWNEQRHDGVETCRELIKKNRGQMKGGGNAVEYKEVHVTMVTRYVIDLFHFGGYL